MRKGIRYIFLFCSVKKENKIRESLENYRQTKNFLRLL